MSEVFDSFLGTLTGQSYSILHEERDQAVVRSSDNSTFIVSCVGDWIRVAQTLLEEDEFAPQFRNQIAELALRIQSRFIGCRFAFDDDGSLDVVIDLLADTPEEMVGVALDQLAYVGSATLPLFVEVESGQVAADERIDLAFLPASE